MEDMNDRTPLYTPPLESFDDYINLIVTGDVTAIIILISIIGVLIGIYCQINQSSNK